MEMYKGKLVGEGLYGLSFLLDLLESSFCFFFCFLSLLTLIFFTVSAREVACAGSE